MPKTLTWTTAILTFAFANMAQAEIASSSTACSSEASAQARKLMTFHVGMDEPDMHVDETVKPLPSIVNPRDHRQRFDVLEVHGYWYKAEYRMRLEYYRIGDECVLVGQEILELASL